MDLLRTHHPLTAGKWESLLVSEGYGRDEARSLAQDPPESYVVELLDGRMVVLDELADRMVLTHRLTADEIAADILVDERDLYVLTMLRPDVRVASPVLGDYAVFEERGAGRLAADIEHGVVLEPGTLASFQAGDLAAVRIARDGAVTVQPVDDPADYDLRPTLDAAVPPGGVARLDGIAYQQAWDHGLLLEPTLPIPELIERAGYVRRGDAVAHTMDDLTASRHASLHRLLGGEGEEAAAPIGVRLGLLLSLDADDRVEALLSVLHEKPGAFDALDDFDAVADAIDTIDEVAQNAATEALLRADGEGDDADAGAGAGVILGAATSVSRILASAGSPRVRPAALHLGAAVRLRTLDAAGAESLLREAVAADPSWLMGHHDLYAFALIRSDLDRALEHLRALPGAEGMSIHGLLEQILAGAGPEPGRNDPCWCGSGRKYKKCHLGRPRLTAKQHSELLRAKAHEFARMSQYGLAEAELTAMRTEGADPRHARTLAADPFAGDVALIEGGILEGLVFVCGDLLPDDDRALARRWLAHGRSVYEVLEARPGDGFTLRDLRTGDRIDVTERRGSADVPAGAFLCLRLVEEDGNEVIYGGIEPVDPAHRVELLDILDSGDPGVLIEFLSRRFAPAQVRTSTGEEVVLCSGTFAVPDTSGLARKLSRRYGKREDATWTWRDGDRVLGTISVDATPAGPVLTVEAMSVERYETMVEHLLASVPGAEPVGESRNTAAELLDSVVSGSAPSPQDPDAAAALGEFVRDCERKWLDDSIPALGGRTPREAVEDPTTRDDVIRLLDSFPQEESPGMMSTARLREMLGL